MHIFYSFNSFIVFSFSFYSFILKKSIIIIKAIVFL